MTSRTPEAALLTRRRLFALGGGSLILAGCGMMREPPTSMSISVVADNTINPNEAGEASPVLVRLYELRSPTVFQQATLFELLDDDQGRLGGDYVGRTEIEAKPGDTATMNRESSPDARYVGVVAAFRNIDNAVWRAFTQVEPRSENRVSIALSGTTVQIQSRRVRMRRLSAL